MIQPFHGRLSLQALLLVVVIFALYVPTLGHGFVWDDDAYLLNNSAVQSPGSLGDIWLSHRMPQYYPLVFTSFWLEYRLWGLEPLGYHAVNLALHAGNAVLLLLVVARLRPAVALPTALLFAVHPLQVETVAWVSERKNLLALLFVLAATWCHLRWREGGGQRPYLLSVACFTLALLSKSVAVTWLVVPLLLRWWRGERVGRRDGIRLLPFALLGAVAAVHTAVLEVVRVGASGEEWQMSVPEHVVLAGRILWHYLGSLVWPSPLMFVYPRFALDPGQLWQWLPWLAFAAGSLVWLAFRGRLGRGGPALAAYVVASLSPALGLFNVYPMRYSFVADHFTYLSTPAALWLLVATGERLIGSVSVRWRRVGGAVVTTLCAVVLAVLTRGHLPAFASAESLWRDVIAKNPSAWMAHNNLGLIHLHAGQQRRAAAAFGAAAELRPDLAEPWLNLATVAAESGDLPEAYRMIQRALSAAPDDALVHNNLGNLLLRSGRIEEAVAAYRRAIELSPALAIAHHNLGVALAANPP